MAETSETIAIIGRGGSKPRDDAITRVIAGRGEVGHALG
jgi:hypothetical protein